MLKCLVVAICTGSLITIVTSTRRYDGVRESQTTRQGETNDQDMNDVASRRSDMQDIITSLREPKKIEDLQSPELSQIAPLNDIINLDTNFKNDSAQCTNYSTNSFDYRNTMDSLKNRNYDTNQYFEFSDVMHMPPPPQRLDDRGLPPSYIHYRPPSPPPYYHPPPPSPRRHPPLSPYHPPPTVHHTLDHYHSPPPPSLHIGSSYRLPLFPIDQRSGNIYDDKQTRQSPYDRTHSSHHTWRLQPWHGQPSPYIDRGPPPRHIGPPSYGPLPWHVRVPPSNRPTESFNRPAYSRRSPSNRGFGIYQFGQDDESPSNLNQNENQINHNSAKLIEANENGNREVSSTIETVTVENQYIRDVRFADVAPTQKPIETIIPQNSVTTAQSMYPFLFQALAVTPED